MPADNEFDKLLHAEMARLIENVVPSDFALEQVLHNVTHAAVNLVEGVNCADILLRENGKFQSVAPTAEIACQLDAVQRRLNQGPCLAAAVSDSTVRCPDLHDEPRWPQFAAAAIRHGVYSMLSFQLYTARGRSGALNLFGYAPHDFTNEVQAVAAMLATHAAMAFAMGDKQDQFHSALASRDAIGQAKGILMERFQVDAVRAFELLKRLSQTENTPLRDVAAEVIKSLKK